MLASFLVLQLTFEGVFGAVAGLWEIAVRSVLHGVGVTVAKLALHGVVSTLAALVRLLGAFSAVRIIEKMIAGAFRHVRPFESVLIVMIENVGYAQRPQWAIPLSAYLLCTCKLL